MAVVSLFWALFLIAALRLVKRTRKKEAALRRTYPARFVPGFGNVRGGPEKNIQASRARSARPRSKDGPNPGGFGKNARSGRSKKTREAAGWPKDAARSKKAGQRPAAALQDAAEPIRARRPDSEDGFKQETLLERVYDLMATGYDGALNFERDILSEGMDMLNKVQTQSFETMKDDLTYNILRKK